jgi:hypothetical protein
MRNALIGRLTRTRHFFHARDTSLSFAAARRSLRHWLRHATDRAIGADMTDLRFNPFVFIAESGC